MLKLTTEDIAWYAASNHKIQAVTSGKSNMRRDLLADFSSGSQTHATLVHLNSMGNTVSAIEKATWKNGETTSSQCAVSIYQFVSDKIGSVTYYDAAPCD